MTAEQQRRIRMLRKEGIGYKRIAVELNLSLNTVKSFCRRDKECGLETEEQTVFTGPQCQNCGKVIHLTDGKRERRFCSGACRVAYWRSQAAPRGEKKCLECGTVLKGHDASRKYCCHACYIAHRFGEGNHVR